MVRRVDHRLPRNTSLQAKAKANANRSLPSVAQVRHAIPPWSVVVCSPMMMLSQIQGPSLPVPVHNLRSPSPCVPPLRSSQPFRRTGMAISPLTEKHEVEGLEELYAGGWISWRLGSIWPTCNRVGGELEDSQQYHRGVGSHRPGPYAPAPPSPHANSVQPTPYPPMIIAVAKPESDAERIRGGCFPCSLGWITSTTPQSKGPGIPITEATPNPPAHPNRPVLSEKPATGPQAEGPRPRAHSEARSTRSKAPAHTLHQPGQAAGPRSRRGSQATMTERVPPSNYQLQPARSRALSQVTAPRSSVYSDATADPRSRVSSGAPLIRPRATSAGLAAEPARTRGRASSHFLTPAVPALPLKP